MSPLRPSSLSTVPNGVSRGEVPSGRSLPMCAALADVVPGGAVRAGSAVACEGRAAATLALAVMAAPSVAGSWVAVIGWPSLGLGAAVEAGVVLERIVRVDALRSAWGEVVAAAIDGFDLVVIGPEVRGCAAGVVRRLVARAAQRGTVLVTVENSLFGADVRLVATDVEWHGLGSGFGVAQGRCAEVEATGRRVPGVRRALLWLPAADGRIRPLDDVAPSEGNASNVASAEQVSARRASPAVASRSNDEQACEGVAWQSAG